MAVFAVLSRIGARDFSPSYRLAARVFMGLKSHAPIDLSPHVNFRFSAPFEFHRMLVTTAQRKNKPLAYFRFALLNFSVDKSEFVEQIHANESEPNS